MAHPKKETYQKAGGRHILGICGLARSVWYEDTNERRGNRTMQQGDYT
jgi:hypothetical protein